jgi:hypothetical protein
MGRYWTVYAVETTTTNKKTNTNTNTNSKHLQHNGVFQFRRYGHPVFRHADRAAVCSPNGQNHVVLLTTRVTTTFPRYGTTHQLNERLRAGMLSSMGCNIEFEDWVPWSRLASSASGPCSSRRGGTRRSSWQWCGMTCNHAYYSDDDDDGGGNDETLPAKFLQRGE